MYDRRPMDSMKSTWRNDPSQWRRPHKVLNWLNAFHVDIGKEVPVHAKTDKLAYMTEWSCHAFILTHAAWPMFIQQVYKYFMGVYIHPFATFLLYALAMQVNAIHEVKLLRRVGHQHGFLDGDKHARDEIPDVGVGKVLASVELVTAVRPMLSVIFAYRRYTPGAIELTWWLPLELGLYSVVLDGWFYLYHRCCHEIDGLWKYHRTHHLTKHPNPLLSSYADEEQEFIEIALIPFLTWATLKYAFGLPMTFHDWWICHQYIIFTEAYGHSGLRIYSFVPGTFSWLLRLLNCELTIEDHDLHHRRGWKKSENYGKQTRVWDRLFGTCGERIEAVPENVDWSKTFNMPLW